jgi:hypothetical protein
MSSSALRLRIEVVAPARRSRRHPAPRSTRCPGDRERAPSRRWCSGVKRRLHATGERDHSPRGDHGRPRPGKTGGVGRRPSATCRPAPPGNSGRMQLPHAHGRLEDPTARHRLAEQKMRCATAARERGTRSFDNLAPDLEQPLIPDSRRTGRLAGERQLRQRSRWSCVFSRDRLAFQHLLDQIDAAARSVELVTEQLEGRTSRVAEAAVHTATQDRVGLAPGRPCS